MDKYTKRQNPVALFSAKVDYLWMRGEISRGMLWRRVIKLGECCLCQAETSGHLITDKWGLVLASARINPFCKHSYPNLLNMSFHNCTEQKEQFYLRFPMRARLIKEQFTARCHQNWTVIPDRSGRQEDVGNRCHNLHLASYLLEPSLVYSSPPNIPTWIFM